MSAFHELEPMVDDAKNAAQVLAALFEDIEGQEVGDSTRYNLTDHDHTLLAHMVYDLCRRTNDLRKAFYSAVDAEKGGSK